MFNVQGFTAGFAVGDITDVKVTKRASAALAHAEVVAANIRALSEGLKPAATHPAACERIVLLLGPDEGASQVVVPDGTRRVPGQQETSQLKKADLYSTAVSELLDARTVTEG